jgi:hypothetical protein
MSHLPKAFGGLVYGVEALQRALARNGYNYDGFRLLIPSALGAEVENEMLGMPVEMWAPYTEGIRIYADGYLKQMILCDSIWVGWKTRSTKGKTDVKSRSAAGNRSHLPRRNAQ